MFKNILKNVAGGAIGSLLGGKGNGGGGGGGFGGMIKKFLPFKGGGKLKYKYKKGGKVRKSPTEQYD